MKAADVVGRRIVAIHQERTVAHGTRDPYYHLHSIELDNGSRIVFAVVEEASDYGLEARVLRKKGAPR